MYVYMYTCVYIYTHSYWFKHILIQFNYLKSYWAFGGTRGHTGPFHTFYQSEGFPLTGYFIPGRVGSWVWPISRILRRVAGGASRVAGCLLHVTGVSMQNTCVFIKNTVL